MKMLQTTPGHYFYLGHSLRRPSRSRRKPLGCSLGLRGITGKPSYGEIASTLLSASFWVARMLTRKRRDFKSCAAASGSSQHLGKTSNIRSTTCHVRQLNVLTTLIRCLKSTYLRCRYYGLSLQPPSLQCLQLPRPNGTSEYTDTSLFSASRNDVCMTQCGRGFTTVR